MTDRLYSNDLLVAKREADRQDEPASEDKAYRIIRASMILAGLGFARSEGASIRLIKVCHYL